MVVEKCPDIPEAVVQETFTHEQYKEQHSDTEMRKVSDRNFRENQNASFIANCPFPKIVPFEV
jgi:galactose-1-phosphate uridylyltransferase